MESIFLLHRSHHKAPRFLFYISPPRSKTVFMAMLDETPSFFFIEQIISTESISLLRRSQHKSFMLCILYKSSLRWNSLHDYIWWNSGFSLICCQMISLSRSFLRNLFPCFIAVITKLHAFYSIQALFETKQSSWLCLMKLRVSSSLSRSFL